jgi:hypothetical protein
LNRSANDNKKWIAKEIILGESYKCNIIEALTKIRRREFKSFNKNGSIDFLYMNPLDIIYIYISQKTKVIHLCKPFAANNENCYAIKWKTRYSALEIIKYLEIDNFVEVNRYHIINLNYINCHKIEEDQKGLQLRLFDGSLKSIPIGKAYRKNLL